MIAPVAEWFEQARTVTESCSRHLPGLVGVYAHGSAALGGMTRASDIDMLVIAESEVGAIDLGASLLEIANHPRALELSVVTATAARHPQQPWPFVLHVNTDDSHVVAGSATNGDPDLIAHYAVTRAAGITLLGPEPKETLGTIDPEQLLSYLCSELLWGIEHGDQRYVVLNACRAGAYQSTGRLLSKLDGASWWLERHGPNELVTQARDAQAVGLDLGAASTRAKAFVMKRVAELRKRR